MPAPITCPSGFSGVIRGLTAKEIEVLGDKNLFKTGEYMDEFLRRCWVETTDKFAYALGQDSKPKWGDVLACDRFYAYVQIGRATWGDDYLLKVQCPSSVCRESFEINIPLNKLSVVELSEASRTDFAAGNKLESWFGRVVEKTPRDPEDESAGFDEKIIIPGRQVFWSLPTGRAIWEITKTRNARKKLDPKAKENQLLDALDMRVIEVEGVEKKKIRTFFSNEELRPVRELFNEMDKRDGGIETETEINCPHCETRWSMTLPFGPEFIFPARK